MNITDADFDLRKLPWRNSRLARDDGARGHQAWGDLLATLFEGQRELLGHYHEIEARNGTLVVPPEMFGEVDDRLVQTRIKDLAFRMIEEITEATNCLKNRPHKTTFVSTDVDHFREELADALHYFVELLMTAGVDADTLFELYFCKHQVNEFRIRSNY